MESLEARLVLATVTFTGNAGNGTWSTAGNWDTNALPQNGDDVVIPNGTAPVIIYNNIAGATALNSLVSEVPFSIGSAVTELSVASSAVFESSLEQGGDLGGSGDITVQGDYTWSGGSLTGSGTTFAQSGVVISGVRQNRLLRTLEIEGPSTWLSGPFSIPDGGELRIAATSDFTVAGDFAPSFGGDNSLTGTGQIVNNGTFRKSAGSMTAQINPDFTNNGTLNVQIGRLLLSGVTNHDSGSNTLTGGTYIVRGELAFPDASIVTNSANIVLDGSEGRIADTAGTSALDGLTDNTGELSLLAGANLSVGSLTNSGTIMLEDGSSLASSGTLTQTAGSIILGADGLSSVTAPLVDLQAGSLQGSGMIAGDLTSSGQVVPGSSGGILEVSGNYVQTSSGSLDVELGGTLSIDDVVIAEGDTGTNDAVFTVELSLPFEDEVKVNYTTTDGTATAAEGDYSSTSGTLTFAPGETSQTVSVAVAGDSDVEPEEQFSVELTNIAGQEGPTYPADGGVVVAEAEEFTRRRPHTLGTTQLVVPTEAAPAPSFFANFRGDGYLRSLPDLGINVGMDPRGESAGGYAEYDLLIDTPGEYRTYARWDGTDGGSDSLYVSVVQLSDGTGGDIADWYNFVPNSDANFNTNPWGSLGGFEETGASPLSAVPIVWQFDTAGLYTLRFSVREDGAALDAFVIQLSDLPAPTGQGPAVTAQQLPTTSATIVDGQGVATIPDDDAAPVATLAARGRQTADLPGFDQIRVGGTVTLDGALNVSVFDGYDPSGNRFQIASFQSASGGFAAVEGSGIDVDVSLESAALFVDAGEGGGGGGAAASVTGRHVVYNGSFFDGGTAADESDDDAIATDKAALLPGETATFANYTSYSRGINAIMVDVAGLATQPTLETVTSFFGFSVGNDDTPGDWETAAEPVDLSVRAGAGVGGSDRVTIVWEDNTIQNGWLQTTVLATSETGLETPDVFYFGNAVGESGNSAADAAVNAQDIGGPRDNPHNFLNRALVGDAFDYNRDSLVNAQDIGIARDNPTNFLSDVNLITVPAAAPEATTRSLSVDASTRTRQNALPVQLQNLAVTEQVDSSSLQDAVDDVALLDQSRLDAAYWRLDESEDHSDPGGEHSDRLDWGDLLLETDLVDVLAQAGWSWVG